MIINGKEGHLAQAISILDLLEGYMLSRNVVVIHVNGHLIPTVDDGTTYLTNDDMVHLTSIVAGG